MKRVLYIGGLALFLSTHAFAGLDAGISAIITPNGCGQITGSFQPIVVLKNYGSVTLNTCSIKYQVDNTTIQTYSWSGSLAASQTTTVTLGYINANGGLHSFNCFSASPNGGIDVDHANDTTISSFYSPYTNGFFNEDFEGSLFPPDGWKILNPDSDITWNRKLTDTIHKYSMYMDNFHYNNSSIGQTDEIISPPIYLVFVWPYFGFSYSYKKYTDPAINSSSDTLEVLVSPDCGNTWTSVIKKYGSQLITSTPAFDTSEFVPKAPYNEWHMQSVVSLQQFQYGTLLFKFRNTTACENNLYIDNFEVGGAWSINEIGSNDMISVSPNPFNSSAEINISDQKLSPAYTLDLIDVLGKQVYSETVKNTSKFILQKGNIPNGIYIIKILDSQNILIGSKKIIVD
jgi:hypothetical protein